MIRRAVAIAVAAAAAIGVSAAQEEGLQQHLRMDKETMAAQVKMMGVQGAVMGKTVKGAPYSGVEITESTQVLADGTRIHNESQVQVYRDSEGRVRREGPLDVTIFDPVANASYVLNAKTQTARKMPLGMYVFSTAMPDGKMTTNFTYRVNTDVPLGDPQADKMMAEKAMAAELKTMHVSGGMGAGTGVGMGGAIGLTTTMDTRKIMLRNAGTTEALGKRMIEGVNSDGSRVVSTIEAGAIGNDRAIQSVNERWFSQELQTVMLTKHTDPRTGEESFRLVNVSRSEPPAYLFQVPAGYQVQVLDPK
jgi:hypothetical protein